MKLLPCRRVLYRPYNHASCHFMQNRHIRTVHTYLAVTCHLHFWQNDRDLLRATAVTRGWNGHRNKSQHRKLTPEKRILPPLLQGFEPVTFQSQVRRSNHRAIPAPKVKWEEGSKSVKMWCGQLATTVDETGLKRGRSVRMGDEVVKLGLTCLSHVFAAAVVLLNVLGCRLTY